MMQPLVLFVSTFLWSLFLLSPVQSVALLLPIQCNETQYAWPLGKEQFCCTKCPPGTFMKWRSQTDCEIVCEPCKGPRYRDTYTTEMACATCERCSTSNMEYKIQCNVTHNAVCTCEAGYQCKDELCKACVPIPSTTTSTPTTVPPSTTAMMPVDVTTTQAPYKPFRADTVWFLVIIVLLCAGIACIVATKIKPFLHWIRSKHGYLLAHTLPPVPPCSDDDEISKPIQEVCGKCDQPLEVCSS